MIDLEFPWKLNIKYTNNSEWIPGRFEYDTHEPNPKIKFIHNGKIKNSYEELFKIEESKIEIVQLEIPSIRRSSRSSLNFSMRIYETEEIPYIENLNSVRTLFKYSEFETIPEDLFNHNPQIMDFSFCFSDCIKLKSIPTNLFKYNNNYTNLYGTFSGCRSLTTIPENLFPKSNDPILVFRSQYFRYCFEKCYGLKTVPKNLFKNVDNRYLTAAFVNCKNLEEIEGDIFSNKITLSINQIKDIFIGCPKLKRIPIDILLKMA